MVYKMKISIPFLIPFLSFLAGAIFIMAPLWGILFFLALIIYTIYPLFITTKAIPLEQEVSKALNSLDRNLPITDEHDVHVAVLVQLRNQLPNATVEHEVDVHRGQSIDIAINRTVGIEVKIADSNNTLRNLVAQCVEYRQQFRTMFAYIIDEGANVDWKYYTEWLEKEGICVIIKPMVVKRSRIQAPTAQLI